MQPATCKWRFLCQECRKRHRAGALPPKGGTLPRPPNCPPGKPQIPAKRILNAAALGGLGACDLSGFERTTADSQKLEYERRVTDSGCSSFVLGSEDCRWASASFLVWSLSKGPKLFQLVNRHCSLRLSPHVSRCPNAAAYGPNNYPRTCLGPYRKILV